VARLREPLPSRVQDLPELPAAALSALDDGLHVVDPGIGPEVRRILADHLRLLLAWNESINLTAIRDPAEAVRRHILDSLAALATLREMGADALVDLGSGGGYPGLPLAVALPARRALLVDSVAKKAGFLEAAVTANGLAPAVEAFAGRAETLADDRRHRQRWPAVTVRALGSLAEVAELGLPLLAPDGVLVVWKRGDVAAEIEAAGSAISVCGGGPARIVAVDPRLGLDDHLLIVVVKRRPTPAGYPRDPAERRRRPL
jgi:16S rRNA (guanine527-N7)-methyltransferase